MALKDFVEVMRPEIEQAIQNSVFTKIPEPYAELSHILAYHLGWEGEGAGLEAQGKRVRPFLVLLAAAAAGGEWQKALPAASSVELIHNFSLLHDDIEDKSDLRRGRLTIWKIWGEALAINAGDLMFTLAQSTVLDLSPGLTAEVVIRASQIINRTCISLTGGQHLDISYEKQRVIPITAYWPMVEGKTAALLECCCELGAVTAGADADQVKNFAQFGRSLGLAFQIQDDYLGIWGDANLTGKSIVSDLVSGKKTLPVLYGLEKEGKFYRRWVRGPIHVNEVPEIARLLETEGAKDYTLDAANQLTERALEELEQATCDKNEACFALKEFAELLLDRRK